MTPPGLWKASKIVTSWPALRVSAAATMPPGPEPMIATFLPVGGHGGIAARASRP
jgi:hypothetical protein